MSIWEELRGGVTTHSAEETMALAGRMAEALPEDAVLTLSGDLGAGKTTFVKGLASAWGIAETVTSPTFNLFSIYKGTRLLVHLDAYRLDDSVQMDELMLDEFLNSPYCLAVEWPERIEDWLPRERFDLRLRLNAEGGHRFQLV